jgi:hypothetical protein
VRELETAHQILDELGFPTHNEIDRVLSMQDRIMRFVRPLHMMYQRLERSVRRYQVYYDADSKSAIFIDQVRRKDGSYSFAVRNEMNQFATSENQWLSLEDGLSASGRLLLMTRFQLPNALRLAEELIEDLERRKHEAEIQAAAAS